MTNPAAGFLDNYQRVPEEVDYDTIDAEEYRIRSIIEGVPIYYTIMDQTDVDNGIEKYGGKPILPD